MIGGVYKDIDIESKIESMKIWWVKGYAKMTNILGNHWQPYWLKAIDGTSVFHSNLELSQISKLKLQTLADFYTDLIKFWISISKILVFLKSDVSDVQDILAQSIWNNKQVTIQKQIL